MLVGPLDTEVTIDYSVTAIREEFADKQVVRERD